MAESCVRCDLTVSVCAAHGHHHRQGSTAFESQAERVTAVAVKWLRKVLEKHMKALGAEIHGLTSADVDPRDRGKLIVDSRSQLGDSRKGELSANQAVIVGDGLQAKAHTSLILSRQGGLRPRVDQHKL